jgi:hypothetical protein
VLYGTTPDTVFKIDDAGTFTTLHSFTGADGQYPGALAVGPPMARSTERHQTATAASSARSSRSTTQARSRPCTRSAA